MPNFPNAYVAPENKVYRFLDSNGDGTGDKNINGDYSSVAQSFSIKPPAGKLYAIHRIIPFIRDNGGGFTAQNYGTIGGGLSSGMLLQVHNGSAVVLDILDGVPLKTNADFGRVCYDVMTSDFGSGDNFLHSRFTFSKSGPPIWLHGDNYLEVVAQDDLTDLVGHYFMVQGQIFND